MYQGHPTFHHSGANGGITEHTHPQHKKTLPTLLGLSPPENCAILIVRKSTEQREIKSIQDIVMGVPM